MGGCDPTRRLRRSFFLSDRSDQTDDAEFVALELRKRAQRELVKLDEQIVALPGDQGLMAKRHNEVVHLQPLRPSSDAPVKLICSQTAASAFHVAGQPYPEGYPTPVRRIHPIGYVRPFVPFPPVLPLLR